MRIYIQILSVVSILLLPLSSSFAGGSCRQETEDACSLHPKNPGPFCPISLKSFGSPCGPNVIPDMSWITKAMEQKQQTVKSAGNSALARSTLHNIFVDQLQSDSREDIDRLKFDIAILCRNDHAVKQIDKEIRALCLLRTNKDLISYKLLKSWPGCSCRGPRGLPGVKLSEGSETDACLEGVGVGKPIDKRVPDQLATFQKLLNGSAWARKSGLHVSSMTFSGCTLLRMSKEDKTHPNDPYQDLSPHAESRACDLKSVSFKGPNGRELNFSLDEFSAGKCAPGSLTYFCLLKGQPNIGYSEEADRFIDPVSRQIAWIAGKIPSRGTLEQRMHLEAGRLIERALVLAHFDLEDPFINGRHHDHIHISAPLPADEQCYKRKPPLECEREKICRSSDHANDASCSRYGR